MSTKRTEPHEFTHDGKHVLIVKCLNRDGTSHNGFVWPKAGPVNNKHWSRQPTCESGGLFGWAWGIGVGSGKDPDACAPWLVFRALPENVVGNIEGDPKCKAVPGENGELPEVVYYGTMAGALKFTHDGRNALIVSNSSSASTSGDRSSASTSGDRSSASTSGDRSSASTSGDSSSASTSGYRSSASTSGYRSSASTSGDRSSASTSGYRSSASTSGESSSASTSGDSSSASTSGYRSIASACGEYVHIEPSKHSIGATTANRFTWTVRKGAVVLCQWTKDNKKFHTKTFDSTNMKVKDGATLKVQHGKVVKDFTPD